MQIKQFIPTRLLQPFIKRLLIIESDAHAVSTVLPDTGLSMVFRLNTSINMSLLAGIAATTRAIPYLPGMKSLIVLFTETGAANFFDQPLQAFFDKRTLLADILPNAIVSIIENKLNEAGTDTAKIAVIEQFLLGYLANAKTPAGINHAIDTIKNNKGAIDIKALAGSLYVSIDAFEKQFNKITGTTPKHFATIIRMRAAIAAKPSSKNLTDLAHRAGYFDQSHFIRAFKLFTNQTPSQFFKSPVFW